MAADLPAHRPAPLVEDSPELDALLRDHGFVDSHWIAGSEVAVAQWVRFKCRYTCWEYGTHALCPPNVPPVAECREMFQSYGRIALIHLPKALAEGETSVEWKRDVNGRLLELERAVFLAGFHKAFALFPGDCCLCAECVPTPADCRHTGKARPVPEALGVDVYETARRAGMPIYVLTDRAQTMNRYAFMLVE